MLNEDTGIRNGSWQYGPNVESSVKYRYTHSRNLAEREPNHRKGNKGGNSRGGKDLDTGPAVLERGRATRPSETCGAMGPMVGEIFSR